MWLLRDDGKAARRRLIAFDSVILAGIQRRCNSPQNLPLEAAKAVRYHIGSSQIQSCCDAHSSVAQLVEQAAVNRLVVGSSPTRGAFLIQIRRFDPNGSSSV